MSINSDFTKKARYINNFKTNKNVFKTFKTKNK